MVNFYFPDWLNRIRWPFGLLLAAAPVYLIGVVYYGCSPRTTDVGYMPRQPVEYSHALHVGQLGLDCRFCHSTVEKAGFAAVPPAETCMGCHLNIKLKSQKLAPLREAYASANNAPVQWVKVHDLPDFVYFNHSAHVTRGVGCVSCHGRIDTMEQVYQHETLSMGWCLDCHRQPERHVRPLDQVTNMTWKPNEDQLALGKRLREGKTSPPTSCSTCHR